MRRTNWKTVSTLISMIVVAGCSDRIASPAASTSAVSATLAPAGRPALSVSTTSTTGAVDFTVGPNGGIFAIGSNAVVFPKGSICDPAKSSYGMGTWDDACTPLTTSIQIHAEMRQQDGRTWVDFTPSLRFVPTTDPSRYVWLYMSTPSAIGSTDLSRFTIYYAPSIGGALYDESLTDSTLRTYVDTRTGVSLRRIKHFSGYTSSGKECDPSLGTLNGEICYDSGSAGITTM